MFFHLCLTLLLSLASSGDRGTSHTTSNSSKDSSAGITNTNLHQVVGTVSASTAAANNTTASATSLMSKALAGFGTSGPSKPKTSASGIGAAVVAAAQAQAASEAKQQHQMAAAVNNISSSTRTTAALQNSSPISAGRTSIHAKKLGFDVIRFIFTL